MAKHFPLPDGTTVAFLDHLTTEEIAERLRSHAELAALGLSRSPRAMAAKVAPSLPMSTPKYARTDWEPPLPGRQLTWAQAYLQRRDASQRAAFDRVYGKHLGRR